MILKGEFGYMVSYKNREMTKVPLKDVAGKLKTVDPKSDIIKEAKMLGISFGD
jgi:6-phosphofructokinase 1